MTNAQVEAIKAMFARLELAITDPAEYKRANRALREVQDGDTETGLSPVLSTEGGSEDAAAG